MGLPRTDYERVPEHMRAIERTLNACKALDKLACCNTYSLDDFQARLELGFDVLTFRSEVDLLVRAGADLLENLRATVRGERPRTTGDSGGPASKKR